MEKIEGNRWYIKDNMLMASFMRFACTIEFAHRADLGGTRMVTQQFDLKITNNGVSFRTIAFDNLEETFDFIYKYNDRLNTDPDLDFEQFKKEMQ